MTEETGRPCQCPILQQRRIRQRCVFTVKLTATNPTPSTVRQSSNRGPPAGHWGSSHAEQKRGQAALSPAGRFTGLFQRIGRDSGSRAGSKRPELGSAAGGVRESPELRCARDVHAALPQKPPQNSPCAAGGPQRSSSHEGPF